MSILTGKKIDLKLVEKEDYGAFFDRTQQWDFLGPFWPPMRHRTKAQAEAEFAAAPNPASESNRYFILDKTGSPVGIALHYLCSQNYNWMEIGYAVDSAQRGKGYAVEAAQILVDFLFLTRQIARIQAVVDTENSASVKVIERAGFTREGELRNAYWTRGKWKNAYLYSITSSEWGSPKIFGLK